MKHRLNLILLAITILVSSFSGTQPISAEGIGGQALEVAPPLINLTANPGQVLNTQVLVRNISNGTLIVNNEIDDFVANGEDGTPRVLVDDGEVSPYSLKTWIQPLPTMTLTTKEIHRFSLIINVPSNASPGGYYGTIRFSGVPPELEGTGLALSASIGSLIMIRVSGEADEQMDIEEFSVNRNGATGTLFETIPLEFVARIKNTGNVFEQPTGQIVISDMFGNIVSSLNVNLGSKNVLPDSIRKFAQTFNSTNTGNRLLFGKYTAQINLSYGQSNKQTLNQTITFWIIPYTLIGVSIVGLIGAFFGLRYAIRRYNQYIINLSRRAHEAEEEAKQAKDKKKNK